MIHFSLFEPLALCARVDQKKMKRGVQQLLATGVAFVRWPLNT